MTFLGAFNAIFRYLGKFLEQNLTSNAFLEGQWYLFSTVFLLGAGHVLQKDRHVRVDVLYERLSKRHQIYIDIIGTFLFLIPFCIFGIWSSWEFAFESFSLREVSPDAGGLPRYPIKVLIPFSFLLLGIHAVFYTKTRIEKLSTVKDNGSADEV
jgi:TRAP-type mannitol/chloroaromatic compound transport system permease small subunit